MFTVLSDKIYRMSIVDKPAERMNIKLKSSNYNITTDKSYFIKNKILSQIPLNHFIVQQKISSIKLNTQSQLACCLVSVNDEAIDFYFETKESPDNHSVIEDIDTFLLEIYFSK